SAAWTGAICPRKSPPDLPGACWPSKARKAPGPSCRSATPPKPRKIYMPFTKNALLRDIVADPAASQVLELHFPGFATWNDWSLTPLATLDEVSHWARGVGEQSPDLAALWKDMAAVESSPTIATADAPKPATSGDRKASEHAHTSAKCPAIPS